MTFYAPERRDYEQFLPKKSRRRIGPVERDLLSCPIDHAAIYNWLWSDGNSLRIRLKSFFLVIDALRRLMGKTHAAEGLTWEAVNKKILADAVSEAAECAEALNL